jgi:hypothetical protein
VEQKIGHFRRCGFRSRFESIYHRIWHWHHEDEIAQGESGCLHPGSSEKEKTSCRKAAKERQGQQRETIVIGRCSAREIGPVYECQNAETDGQEHARNWKIGNIIFG